jgi:hypothetical protein
VTVTLSRPSPVPVHYYINTYNDGAALPGQDWNWNWNHDAIIPAGQTTAKFAVVILGDNIPEWAEAFHIHYVALSGASGGGMAEVRIEDDD